MLELYFNKTMRLLLVYLLCFLGVDAATDKVTRIFQGTDANIKQHPYLVWISDSSRTDSPWTGVIINKSWVITLGDKAYKSNATNLRIRAGSDSITGGTEFSGKQSVRHPNYNHDFNMYNYDVYLIQIVGEFTKSATVGFASLPTSALSAGTAVIAVGLNNPATGGFRQGTMKWLSLDDCKRKHTPAVTFQSDTIGCAHNPGTTTLCSADLGAAFVKDGTLYGLFSRFIEDKSCSASAEPVLVAAIYPVLAAWIQETIG